MEGFLAMAIFILDAINVDGMKMDVQIKRSSKTLNDRDCSGFWFYEVKFFCLPFIMPTNRAVINRQGLP